MPSRQWQAGDGLVGVASRTLGLACVALLFALRASAVPAAPGSLLATPANARVTVTWNAVAGATGYNVYRSSAPGGPYGSPLAGGLTATSYTDNAVSNNTTYYYVATAIDGTGEGPLSAEDPATPRVGTFVSGLIGGSSGPITTTWSLAGSPYVVVGDVEVRGNVNTSNNHTSTLVVQSGVRVLFESGTGLFIGDDTGTVAGHSGRLQATGATFSSNRTNPAAGDWKGIRFGDTATDGGANNFLDGCTVEWAGGGGFLASVLVNRSSPELRNGTSVRGGAARGIHVAAASGLSVSGAEIESAAGPAVQVLGDSSLSLTGTTLRGGSYPVQIQPNVALSTLSGNTASGYPSDRNGIAVEGGLMGSGASGGVQSRTWPGGDLPYIVLADLTVRGDINTSNDHTSTLVIQSATVRFEPGKGLFIGDDSGTVSGHSGRLQATSVTFTSNRTSPAPGDWKGIRFGDTATNGGANNFLANCTVEWAGGTGALGSVVIFQSSPELRGGTIVRGTSTVGVHVSVNGGVTVTGGEIQGGSGPAVQMLDRSTLSLTGVRLVNGSYPVQIQPNVVLSALGGNTASGYPADRDGIAVEGGLMGSGSNGGTQSRIWPGGDLPYIVLADLTVRGEINTSNDHTSTLVIQSTTVRFEPGKGLFIGDDSGTVSGHSGRLQATSVIFTSNRTSPALGDWKGIRFGDTATNGGANNFLANCTVEWAGGAGALGSVVIFQSSPELRGGTIVRSTSTVGVHVSVNGSVTVTGGEIQGGSGPAVQVLDRSTLSLTGVRLVNGSYPVQIQPNVVLSALSGNTASRYPADRNGIAVEGGLMSSGSSGGVQSRTWPGGDLPYIVLADVTVRGEINNSNDHTSTLVIGGSQPAEVRFNAGAGLTVGSDTGSHGGFWGQLQATGVTFKGNAASPSAGFWDGIYFADTARDGGLFLDACVVEGAGGAGTAGAVAVNASSVALRNGTIVRTVGNVGLYLSASTATLATVTGGEIEGGSGPAILALDRSTLSLTGVTLRGGTYPVRMQPNVVLSVLSGNTASGYLADRNGIAVEGGLMSSGSNGGVQSRTWPGGDLPYIVLADLTVRGEINNSNDHTSTLVIQSTTVRFEPGKGLFIGDDSGTVSGHSGRLLATSVTFTSNRTSPAPGDWKGIRFGDTATNGGANNFLANCTVEWAGGAGALGSVVIFQSSPELRGGTIVRGTSTVGVHVSVNGSVMVTGGEIQGGSGPAVQGLDRSALSLTGVRLVNGSYPLQMQPNVVLSALSGNTASGYPAERNGIAVEGGLMSSGSSGGVQSRTWPGGDLPYIVLADVTVRGDINNSNDHTSTLVIGGIQPAEVRFNAGAGLTVGSDTGSHGGFWGQLQATGVTFKGNTVPPLPGFWDGIYFADTARDGGLFLDACVVEGAGGTGTAGAVTVNASSVALRNGTTIRTVGNVGLYLSASTATLATMTGGEIEGGSGPAVLALDRSTLSLTGVTLRGGTYPVRMQPNVVLSALSGNTASGYAADRNGIAVEGGLMSSGSNGGVQSRTWPGGDLPYIVLDDLTVRGNINNSNDHTSTLEIAPPAEVRFNAGAGLTIGSDTGSHGGFWGQLLATGVTFAANTAVPTVGFWDGIYFADTAREGGLILDACVVEGAGGAGAAGAVAVNATTLELRNGTVIRATGNTGLHLSASTATVATVVGGEIQGGSGPAVQALGRSTLSLSGVTLRAGTHPVQIQPNVILATLNGNRALGYAPTQDAIAVEGGLMSSNGGVQSRTWPGGDLPYIVLADLTVRGDVNNSNDHTSTLIIGSPTEVRFAPGAGLFIGDDSGTQGGHNGRLQATGVTFTASSATPVPGFWKGIYFADQALDGAANTFLDHCAVEWAGGDVPGAVWVNASAPVLKNGVTIRNPATSGVYLSSSSASQVTILGGEVEGGSDAAVRATGSSTVLLRDVTLRGGTHPMRIEPNVNVAGLRGCRMEGYPFERAGVAVDGGLMGGGLQTRVWPASDLPFLVLGDVQVRGNQNTGSDRTSTLVLQSGGEVRFERDAGLQIGDDSGIDGGHWGALQASGVTFTANTLTPVPGFWNGLYFADQSRDDVSFLFDGAVEYGGAVGGNISIYRSSPYLSGVAVRSGGQDGILASASNAVLTGVRLVGSPNGFRLFFSGAPSLTDSDIEKSSRFGAFNFTASSLFARFNWWGDPSGPLDPVANAGGLGERVSEQVDYASWLATSPLPPVAPERLTARPGDRAVSLAWTANPERDLAGYHVYRRLPPASAWTLRTASPVPASVSPSFEESGLSNRTEHCYQVRAVDSQAREGDSSREVCATPKADVTPPAWTGPAGALFAEGGDGRAVVRFEPAADESSVAYNLYYSTASPVDRNLPGVGRIASAVPVPSSAGHGLEVTVPGLAAGQRYFFNLQAVDAEGNPDGNGAEATAVIGPASGAVVAASPWSGATLDGVEVDGDGRVVLAAGRTEGQLTSAVLELPAGADLSAVAWNALAPAGTAVDTVPGGAPTLEVRASDDPARLADPRCIAPTGVAGWWPGDGNGRNLLSGRDEVLRNGVAFEDGRSRQAFQFDGTDDYVDPQLDVSETAYTLSLWFKTSCVDCGLFSVDAGTLGGSGHDRHLFLSNGRLCSRVWSDETICTSVGSYADERWHHAVHVFGGTVGGQKIFVDGVQRASGSKASSNFTGQTGVNLGFSNDAASGFFRGLLDEVVVFNRALTASEIQTLYAAAGSGLCKADADGDGVADLSDACPATPARTPVDTAGCTGGCFGPPANRVSWWRGEESGADSAGANAGTLAGGTSFDLGQVGQAFRFDGVDDRVEIPNFGSFTRVTVQTWVYREGATSTRESLVSYKEGDNPNCGFVLSLNEDGFSQRPRLFVNVNGGWQSTEAAQSVPFGRWTHLAGSYDGQEIRLYVDGVLAASTAVAGNMTQCTQKTGLGMRASLNPSYPYFFPGLLDEVAIFDRALSASEVQALAETRSAGMCITVPPPSGVPAGTPQVAQGWVQVAPNQVLDLPDGRFVQFRITLRGGGTMSPALRSVSLGYRGGGL